MAMFIIFEIRRCRIERDDDTDRIRDLYLLHSKSAFASKLI